MHILLELSVFSLSFYQSDIFDVLIKLSIVVLRVYKLVEIRITNVISFLKRSDNFGRFEGGSNPGFVEVRILDVN